MQQHSALNPLTYYSTESHIGMANHSLSMCFAYSTTLQAEAVAYLGCRRGSWHRWSSQRGLGWWAAGRSGSLVGWPPWSAGRPPGSPAPECGGSSHHWAHCQSPCAPSAHLHGSADHLKAHNSRSCSNCVIYKHINNLATKNWLLKKTAEEQIEFITKYSVDKKRNCR